MMMLIHRICMAFSGLGKFISVAKEMSVRAAMLLKTSGERERESDSEDLQLLTTGKLTFLLLGACSTTVFTTELCPCLLTLRPSVNENLRRRSRTVMNTTYSTLVLC